MISLGGWAAVVSARRLTCSAIVVGMNLCSSASRHRADHQVPLCGEWRRRSRSYLPPPYFSGEAEPAGPPMAASKPFEVLHTRIAVRQVGGDLGVAAGRVAVSELAFHVAVEQLERLGAAGVGRIGPQEPLQRSPAIHGCLETSSSRYP